MLCLACFLSSTALHCVLTTRKAATREKRSLFNVKKSIRPNQFIFLLQLKGVCLNFKTHGTLTLNERLNQRRFPCQRSQRPKTPQPISSSLEWWKRTNLFCEWAHKKKLWRTIGKKKWCHIHLKKIRPKVWLEFVSEVLNSLPKGTFQKSMLINDDDDEVDWGVLRCCLLWHGNFLWFNFSFKVRGPWVKKNINWINWNVTQLSQLFAW